MQRNEARVKSGRRPLKELSNAHNNQGNGVGLRNNGGKWSSKPVSGKKTLLPSAEKKLEEKSSTGRCEEGEDDGSLDRLLLVQSDLSNLTRQIDEIVVQPFKLKEIGKEEKEEIESFASFLAEMLSSLKPWVPRLRNALSGSPKESEKLMEPSLVGTNSGTGDEGDDDDENILVSSPEQTMESLISPSPLVSWRANCTVERGRQVFLLTPLPMSKALSSKCQDSTRSVLEKIASITSSWPLRAFSEETNDDLLKDEAEHPNSSQPSEEPGPVSPLTLPRRDYSMVIMTPCFKVSPPKSCALLEPVSVSTHWKNCNTRKSTPFPVKPLSNLGEESSESSGSETSDYLATKYPELLGIRQAQKLGLGKKDRESSPDWFCSPPKSCILMEPPDETPANVAANTRPLANQEAGIFLSTEKPLQGDHQGTQQEECFGRSLALIESTPIWKDPESTFGKGKRPGETTLKKELWTKFEAASYGFLVKGSAVLDSENKGFLDRLDEVSLDEKSPGA
ncbi:uncharacterized protein LOC116198498 [Punica granatum]|uniref:Uncharacterized protein n=2 Tax=Punica granatum TaxID=22663 RepID=A0A218WUI8_PUNGR|nr:uncharacterized protein LOC116198498 [Punica granatum]OWM76514.1 hypothetical protein CDL15_Pgr005478 [Punica granatum]PKI71005.1 hypothetical protein CRG98_008586 [Punica granatum]